MAKKRKCKEDSLKYIAAAIADFLTEGLEYDDIRKLFAFVNLIANNLQAIIVWQGFVERDEKENKNNKEDKCKPKCNPRCNPCNPCNPIKKENIEDKTNKKTKKKKDK